MNTTAKPHDFLTETLDKENTPHHPKRLGTCALVGAGPGDPDLLTIKAVKAIAKATVILVDDLVNPEVLAYADASARIIHVGKRGGCKSTPQAFIEKLMIQQVCEGHNVVRLKGGDPLFFGRCAEELASLRAAGIEPEIINGITSGVAAATSLSASLTHREAAHGVLFITGHAAPNAPALDWKKIAGTARDAKLTLVIYMGVKCAKSIQQGLLQGGLGANTPVAVVQSVSLAGQKQVLTDLGALCQVMTTQKISSPSIIIVGDVLKGCQVLQQYEDEHTRIDAAIPDQRQQHA